MLFFFKICLCSVRICVSACVHACACVCLKISVHVWRSVGIMCLYYSFSTFFISYGDRPIHLHPVLPNSASLTSRLDTGNPRL